VTRAGKIAVGFAVALALLAPLVVALVVTKVINPYRLPSESMEPTYDVGTRVLAGRNGFPFGEAEVGDVVIAEGSVENDNQGCAEPRPPDQACARADAERTDTKFIKRIVADEGDRVKIEGGRAVVNGKPLDEPYARFDDACEVCNLPREITVPDGHVFLMGDNRGASLDSRIHGPVPEDWIVGKVLFRYWPG
jgi:signal peptidase I